MDERAVIHVHLAPGEKRGWWLDHSNLARKLGLKVRMFDESSEYYGIVDVGQSRRCKNR